MAKGKKLKEWRVDASSTEEMVDAMLGPTGNLRAPTLVTGSTILVGFNEQAYAKRFD